MAPGLYAANNGERFASFAALLSAYRLRAGLSQGQLAHAARLSRTYVYHLESGQRCYPSEHTVRALVRGLGLTGSSSRAFLDAVEATTGLLFDDEAGGDDLLDIGALTELLVANTAYPTHGLDRLWRVSCWNEAAAQLFELDPTTVGDEHPHLLAIVFDPAQRSRFRPWEPLARRLVADFKWSTAAITHLPEYKALWRQLRTLPDFRRIAEVTPAAGLPGPSFVMGLTHSKLGPLAVRTVSTLFSGVRDHHIISYVPGDAQTLEVYRRMGWQGHGY